MLKLLPILRVSTTTQGGSDGEGLDRQRAAVLGVARAHDAILLPAVEVVGVSGGDLDQTSQWRDQILPQLRDPNTHVVADSLDRILRVDRFNFLVFQEFVKTDTRVYTPGKVHDLSSQDGSLFAGLLALLAGRERQEIKRRANAGKEAARKRGEWVSPARLLPRGVLYTKKTKAWTYDEEKLANVKTAYDLFIRGESLHNIARIQGRTKSAVRFWLRNPIYRGIVNFTDRIVNGKRVNREEPLSVRVFGGEGQLPQAISDDVWFAINRTLDANEAKSAKTKAETSGEGWASSYLCCSHGDISHNGEEFGLGGLNIKSVYSGGAAGNDKRYTCSCSWGSGGRRPDCTYKSARCRKINGNLDEYLTRLTAPDSWFVQILETQANKTTDTNKDVLSTIEKRLGELDKKEKRLNELYVEGEVTRSQRDDLLKPIRSERDQLVQQKETRSKETQTLTPEDVTSLVNTWGWNRDWSGQQKRDWLARYQAQICVDTTGFRWAVLRIPGAKGPIPVFGGGGEMPWVTPVYRALKSRGAPPESGT